MDDQNLGDAREPEGEGVCPACHAPVFAANNYCEACGHRISAAAPAAGTPGPAGSGPPALLGTGGPGTGGPGTGRPGAESAVMSTVPESSDAGPCTGCGSTAIDVDGYCERCGLRRPGGRDHLESELTGAEGGVIAAGVSDKGLRHSKNEDAMALAAVPDGVAAVVCDGVSSSPRPEDASQVAADTGVAVLVKELESGADAETATRRAVLQAAQAVAALAPSEHDAPACTYVSALTGAGTVTVGWVGDSRAYWLPVTMGRPLDPLGTDSGGSGRGRRLTQDDSWAEQMVALGALSEAEAQTHRNAHVLVGWLGADADAVQAHVRTFRPGSPGVVIVCSDGLWNYLPEAATIGGVLAEELPGPPSGVSAAAAGPLAAARSLVDVALDSGGRDNITVVVIPVVATRPASPSDPARPANSADASYPAEAGAPPEPPAPPSTEPAV
ncbi:PP2C family protein-serine/threonine phosphatase [Actinomadura scrupuli]|uniref:PP2C family protein-serine/threonine phosphatase n=1 Tax=Actinomadura scrupuli TaxID=559629 RepID=UPI003D97E839